jgi:hypothetical protein
MYIRNLAINVHSKWSDFKRSDSGEVRGQQMRKGWQWGWQRLDTSGVTVARLEANRAGRGGKSLAEAGHQEEVRG